CAAGRDLLYPHLQCGNFLWFFWRQRSELWRIGLGDKGDRQKLLKTGTLVIAAQGAIREKIYRQQHAQQQREKSQREFGEEITPHEFRTGSPLRGPSSDAAGSPR